MKTKIYEKMKSLSNFAKMSIPERHGKHYYVMHDTGLQN